MKKINTSPISGMQELLPEAQATFNNLKEKIGEVYHAHGFLSIETPTIDRAEILFAKAGGDTEKQVYKVYKTAETADEADEALRFDHTVPLARYVVEHENDLTFPFKATQIGRNFRGERAQKGRFREFYQCDVDIIGRGTLPLNYDADVISTLLDAFAKFELNTPVLARISNRKILSGFLAALDLTAQSDLVFNVIDHAEKVSLGETRENLAAGNISEEKIDRLVQFMNIHGSRETVIASLYALSIQDETFETGVNELNQVLGLLEMQGLADSITADLKIVRGLDYYTGTVFEFNLPEHREIGSVCGGGRYENLASNFTDQALPGVGGSIGLTRLFSIFNEKDMLEKHAEKPIDFEIIPISENELAYCLKIAKRLRDSGNKVDIVLTDKRLGDKMTYASKIARCGIVIGEDEVRTEQIKAKDFQTGDVFELEF